MYAAMLLHKAGTEVNELNIMKVLEAAGVKADKAKASVVVNALKDVDIEKVLSEASVAPVAAAPTEGNTAAEEKKEDPKEEEEKQTAAAEGLGALFG